MSKKRNVILIDWLFPLLITAVVYASVLAWLKLDTSLPHWDMGRHLYHTLLYRQLWTDFFHGDKNIFGLVSMYFYYPPLVHNIGLLFQELFGFTRNVAVASNIVWILMLIFSAYGLGKGYFNRLTGMLAAIIVASSPMLIGQFREFQIDMPLTAIFALSFYLLNRTQKFTSRKYSLLFGLSVGLGMMTKWTFAFYILPPILFFIIAGLVENKKEWKRVAVNILIAGASAMIICGAWYLRNISALRNDFSQNGVKQAQVEGDPYGINLPAFSWYLKRLVGNYLFLPLSSIFMIGSLFTIISRKWRTAGITLFLLIFIYYLIFSWLPNKDTRYIMPMISLIAILAASAINIFRSKIYKSLFFILIISIFIINNAYVSYGKYLPFKTKELVLNSSADFGVLIGQNGYTSDSPKKMICPMDQLINTLPKDSTSTLTGMSSIDFNNWAYAYYLTKSGRIWTGELVDLLKLDYIVVRDQNSPEENLSSLGLESKIKLVKTFQCEDLTKVRVYKVDK